MREAGRQFPPHPDDARDNCNRTPLVAPGFTSSPAQNDGLRRTAPDLDLELSPGLITIKDKFCGTPPQSSPPIGLTPDPRLAMKHSHNYPPLAAALAALALASGLHAQTPPNTPATNPADVVQLSEFTVSSSENRGYVSSETMTGSRVATRIIDLPYTVNVLTSEFFEEFGLFELSDNITQVGSFTGLDIGGNFNLRGFTSSYQLRDGFFRLGRYGSSNIDRLEIIKGSNAAIYGRTSPGGMVNMISKSPKDKVGQKLSYNYGDYGTQRITGEVNGKFPASFGKTRYLVIASHYQRDFNQDFARNRNQEYYAAVDHVFGDGSKLTLTGEFFFQMRHAPFSAVPLIVDQKGTAATADDTAVGYAVNLGKYNPYGPNSVLNRGSATATAIYEKKFNSIFSTRISGNFYGARRWDYNQNTGWGTINLNPANAAAGIVTVRGATPNYNRIIEDGGGFQGDLLAHYWTNGRKLEHRTLLTFDANDYYRWDPTLSYGPATNPDLIAWNAVRTVRLDANYNPVAPLQYFTKSFNESTTGGVVTRSRRIRSSVFGGLLRQQTALFESRLLAYAGARYDTLIYNDRDFFTPAAAFASFIPGYVVGQKVHRKLTALKPNAGLNYKVTPNLRLFANYSQSYFTNVVDNVTTIADPTFKPETADGWDYGFKGALFNDGLSFTVSGFYINRHDVTSTNRVESPVGSGNFIDVTGRDGDQLVRGYEIDANWSITEEASILVSYGRVHSVYTDFGTSFPAAIGRKVQFVAPYNGSVSAKYSPRAGRLKGFSVNLGLTFVGATPTELPNAGDVYTTTGPRTVTSSTGQWSLRTPAYQLWNLGLHYKLPTKSKYAHAFSVNVNNLADKIYLRTGASAANRLPGEERAVYFTYTLNHTGARF